MPVFSKITTTLSAVLALTSVVHAAPLQPAAAPDHNYKLSTHRRQVGASNVEFVSYHPPSSYKTFHDGDHSLLSRSENATHIAARAPAGPSGVSPEVEEAALSYLSEQTGLAKDSLKVRSGYTNDLGVTHVYLTQMLNGIPVTNGVANISFDKTGKVVAFGSNMVKPGTQNPVALAKLLTDTLGFGVFSPADQISPPTPAFPESSAIQSAQQALGIAHYDPIPATLAYVVQPAPSGTDPNRKWAMLTHQFQLRNADSSKWVEAYVDATNPKQGDVVQVVNFVADASYNALPWNKQDPTWADAGASDGFTMITNPEDSVASPDGWHRIGDTSYTDTQGNNVISYFMESNIPFSTSQQTSDGPTFDFKWDSNSPPAMNLDVGRVNAFYISNTYHDTLYRYGFTEAAFNFQKDNGDKGGRGNDRIEMQVQAPGQNNANFATPPDGQSGHCNMYIWTRTTNPRDGDLENDIITHELTHGLTNRMTGGGSGRCLQTLESGGMGEGWSDAVAFWSEQNSTTISDFTMGGWVTNNPKGIRKYPYTTDMRKNPYTYVTLRSQNEVHAVGEVWATMLVEVYWALVGQYGFTPEITKGEGGKGNIVFMHLLVDALPLQPCNPTFIQARNAIIQAEINRYGGRNYCLLWRAFAKRGLGWNAANYMNGFAVPQGC
ncbi:hypothetical protein FS837_006000 [Tulasnella sp. UAMH 9824]|nr:hypothetical protein FS837_006000 [Tulasnella sp. UAMH 9824]